MNWYGIRLWVSGRVECLRKTMTKTTLATTTATIEKYKCVFVPDERGQQNAFEFLFFFSLKCSITEIKYTIHENTHEKHTNILFYKQKHRQYGWAVGGCLPCTRHIAMWAKTRLDTEDSHMHHTFYWNLTKGKREMKKKNETRSYIYGEQKRSTSHKIENYLFVSLKWHSNK